MVVRACEQLTQGLGIGQLQPGQRYRIQTAAGGVHDQGCQADAALERTTAYIQVLHARARHAGVVVPEVLMAHGQRVRILTDLVAGVAPEPSEAALAEVVHAGGELAESGA